MFCYDYVVHNENKTLILHCQINLYFFFKVFFCKELYFFKQTFRSDIQPHKSNKL